MCEYDEKSASVVCACFGELRDCLFATAHPGGRAVIALTGGLLAVVAALFTRLLSSVSSLTSDFYNALARFTGFEVSKTVLRSQQMRTG